MDSKIVNIEENSELNLISILEDDVNTEGVTTEKLTAALNWYNKLIEEKKINFRIECGMRNKASTQIRYTDLQILYDLSVSCNNRPTAELVKKKYQLTNLVSCGGCCSALVEQVIVHCKQKNGINATLKHNSIIGHHNGTYYTVCDFFVIKKHLENNLPIEFGKYQGQRSVENKVILAIHNYHFSCSPNRHTKEVKERKRELNQKKRKFNKDSVNFLENENNSNDNFAILNERASQVIMKKKQKEYICIDETSESTPKSLKLDLTSQSSESQELELYSDMINSTQNYSYNEKEEIPQKKMLALCSNNVRNVLLEPTIGQKIQLDLENEFQIKNSLEKLGVKFYSQEGIFFSKYFISIPDSKWVYPILKKINEIIGGFFNHLSL